VPVRVVNIGQPGVSRPGAPAAPVAPAAPGVRPAEGPASAAARVTAARS
jgi:hypothetical protein